MVLNLPDSYAHTSECSASALLTLEPLHDLGDFGERALVPSDRPLYRVKSDLRFIRGVRHLCLMPSL